MDYNTIHNTILSKTREIHTMEKEILAQQQRLKTIEVEINSIDKKQASEIEAKQQSELTLKQDEAIKELEQYILDADSDLLTVQTRYNEAKSKINKEEVLKDYEEDLQVIEEVKDLSLEVKDTLTKLLGDRLNSSLFKNLDDYKIDINSDDLKAYASKKDSTLKALSKLGKARNYNFYTKVDELLSKLNPCKDDEAEGEDSLSQSLLSYIILCGSISFAVMYFGSSALFTGCLGIGYMNVRRAGNIRKLLLDSKVLLDNTDRMYSKIMQDVDDDINDKLNALDEEYQNTVSSIQERRSTCEQEIQEILADVKANFKFDPKRIIESYKLQKASKERELASTEESILLTRKKQKGLEADIEKLKEQLRASMEEIKKTIFSFKGNDKLFNPKYILDFINNKEISWEHPRTSSLFLYSGSSNVVKTFIRLFTAQTLSKFIAGFAEVDIWDTVSLGASYRVFAKVPKNPKDTGRGPVVICRNEEMIADSLSENESELAIRIEAILQEAGSIEQYNKLMLDPEINGNCKPYKFLLIENCDPNVLDDNKLIRVFTEGPSMGIYPSVFMEIESFKKLGEKAEVLLRDNFEVYTLEENGPKRIAKSKVRAYIKQKDS